jgi:predicted metal-dependent phosphoesterase TrpH
MSFVGAGWWRFYFHTHTPASYDYGKGDGELKNSMTPRSWLLEFINKGIECVAVTDHNTGEWIDQLKDAAQLLRVEGYKIHIFPGVEITANSNIHILGIFDPTFTSADINGVVGAAKFRGDKGNSNAVAEENAENIVEEIIKFGGIAIPAHIDMPAGLCHQAGGYTIEQVCKKVNAVEVIFPEKTDSVALSRFKNLNIDKVSVVGSDSHKPCDVGRAFTWIKMSTPCIDGLRLALIDGKTSTLRSDQAQENPNQSSKTIVESICISNAKYAGRNIPLEISFNPWLNSIIGGRGSGKSSILEFIRIGMDRSRELLNLPDSNEVR